MTQEQPGGKTNQKDALPRQVVELTPPTSVANEYIQRLGVRVHMLGYDRNQNGFKIIEDDVETGTFSEVQQHPFKKYWATFSNIICKHSSHLNGQKVCDNLLLVFKL